MLATLHHLLLCQWSWFLFYSSWSWSLFFFVLLIVVVTFSCVHDHGPSIIYLDRGHFFFGCSWLWLSSFLVFLIMVIVVFVLIRVVAFFCVPCGDCHLFLCSKYGHHFFHPNHSCCFLCFWLWLLPFLVLLKLLSTNVIIFFVLLQLSLIIVIVCSCAHEVVDHCRSFLLCSCSCYWSSSLHFHVFLQLLLIMVVAFFILLIIFVTFFILIMVVTIFCALVVVVVNHVYCCILLFTPFSFLCVPNCGHHVFLQSYCWSWLLFSLVDHGCHLFCVFYHIILLLQLLLIMIVAFSCVVGHVLHFDHVCCFFWCTPSFHVFNFNHHLLLCFSLFLFHVLVFVTFFYVLTIIMVVVVFSCAFDCVHCLFLQTPPFVFLIMFLAFFCAHPRLVFLIMFIAFSCAPSPPLCSWSRLSPFLVHTLLLCS